MESNFKREKLREVLRTKLDVPDSVDCCKTVKSIIQAFIDNDTDDKEILEVLDEIIYRPDLNGYFPNQIDLARKIYEALKQDSIVLAKAPMQFGKTGAIHCLVNMFLAPSLKDGELVVFMTAMSDSALFVQNQANLQTKEYLDKKGNRHKSKVLVVKMVPDFRDKAEIYIKESNVKYLVFDECDYGTGNRGLFNKVFFDRIKKAQYDINIILVSATPYCALNAYYNGDLKAGLVNASIPDNYFGVSKMLQNNLVTDINNIYGDESRVKYTLLTRKAKNNIISEEFTNDLVEFQSQEEGGLAIVRAKSANEAKTLKNLIDNKYNKNIKDGSFEVIAIGVSSELKSIKLTLSNDNILLYNKIKFNKVKVLLIVVNALSAGKDLGELKEYVRLIVETRGNAIANGSQGLVGRVCGYHENTNIKIVASLDVLNNYAELEKDSSVMEDSNFIDNCNNLKLDLSTQLKKGSKSKDSYEYKQSIHGPYTVEDIEKEKKELRDHFPDNNTEYGTWDDVKKTIKLLNAGTGAGAINTQRSSKYVKEKPIFKAIFNSCVNGTIKFGNAFHRFRSEGNDESRLRIKTGFIFDDENENGKGLFYFVKRLDDGVKITTDATINNNSCYINKKK